MTCTHNSRRCPSGLKIVGGIVLGVGAAFLFGWIIMLLWNALMPAVFSLAVITYWQAVGLAILARLLFGGVHGGGKQQKAAHAVHSHHHHDAPSHVKDWHYYDEWWQSEGEKSFRDYAEKERSDDK